MHAPRHVGPARIRCRSVVAVRKSRLRASCCWVSPSLCTPRCAARGPCGSAPWLPRGGRCWHGAIAVGLVNLTSAVNAHFLDVKISQQPADVRFPQPVDVFLNAWIIGVKVHV